MSYLHIMHIFMNLYFKFLCFYTVARHVYVCMYMYRCVCNVFVDMHSRPPTIAGMMRAETVKPAVSSLTKHKTPSDPKRSRINLWNISHVTIIKSVPRSAMVITLNIREANRKYINWRIVDALRRPRLISDYEMSWNSFFGPWEHYAWISYKQVRWVFRVGLDTCKLNRYSMLSVNMNSQVPQKCLNGFFSGS